MGAFVYINLSTMICLFIFTIFLYCIYFSKKNMDNIENKIYRHLLIWNIVVVLVTFFYELFIILKYDMDSFSIITKLYCCSICSWGFYLSFYIGIVTNEHNEKIYRFFNKKSTFNFFNLFIFLSDLLLLILPMGKMVLENGEFRSVNGPVIICYSIYSIISVLASTLFIIVNRKKVNKKKILPFYFLVPLIIIAVIVVSILPQYATIQMAYTLTCYLMFHTIENPDLKMITELELARDKAEKASNAKSDFLSSMSHELRTPLNAIIGLSEIIQQESDKEEVKEDAVDIYNSSNNLLDIVDGILDINKIDSNKMELEEVEYNPTNLFEDIKKKSLIRLNGKDIDLIFNIPSLPNKLFGDKNKINTIVNNLISNSIKYTDKGRIQCSVVCNISKDIANFNIKVSDTGRGIDDDSKDLLFTRFNRREEDKDSNISGTGLGLFLTKSLLDIIGGKIDVSSEEGFGSTFTINFSQKIVEENDTEIL